MVIDTDKPLNAFVPREALGAALDGMAAGEVDRSLTPYNIEKMRSAGLKRLTYRTRAELGEEAWHWSEEGSWSDGAHAQGYWTSSDNPSRTPAVTWGYSLPRRGDSVDQANDLGYSRIDDGDPASFWKSDPYLDARYTGAAAVASAVDRRVAERPKPGSTPRASSGGRRSRGISRCSTGGATTSYWDDKDVANKLATGPISPTATGAIAGEPDDGGPAVLEGSDTPVRACGSSASCLLAPSETAPPGSTDVRDRLGYAVR